jgi:hypothetical protein
MLFAVKGVGDLGALDMRFAAGYEGGLSIDRSDSSPALSSSGGNDLVFSNNFSFSIRFYLSEISILGIAAKGTYGIMDSFAWEDQRFTDDDGTIHRFSLLIGPTLRIRLSKIAIHAEVGLAFTRMSLKEDHYWGAIFGKPYQDYDTRCLDLRSTLIGAGIEGSIEYMFTSRFFVEGGIDLHYYPGVIYSGEINLAGSIDASLSKAPLRKANTDISISTFVQTAAFIHLGVKLF